MKVLKCENDECQKEIKYGDDFYHLSFRDHVYCSIDCFASSMALTKESLDLTDEINEYDYKECYDAWFEEEEKE